MDVREENRQEYRRTKKATATTGNGNKVFRKIMGLEFGKQASGFQGGYEGGIGPCGKNDPPPQNEKRNGGWSGSRDCRSTGP
jgi:hypothetical protein